jgi:hypothetical protein
MQSVGQRLRANLEAHFRSFDGVLSKAYPVAGDGRYGGSVSIAKSTEEGPA